MKRTLFKLVLLLVVGVIINVAVAWGCVCWCASGSDHGRLKGCDWIGSVPNGWPRYPQLRAAFDGFGYEEDLAIWSEQTRPNRSSISYWQLGERAGWPARSLSVVRTVTLPYFDDPTKAERRSLNDGWEVPAFVPFRMRPGWRSLPAQTIWPGFAINAIFYAGIVWLLFAAPVKLRRWRRIERGLCPACSYPVGTNPRCTECGKPVTPTSIKPAT